MVDKANKLLPQRRQWGGASLKKEYKEVGKAEHSPLPYISDLGEDTDGVPSRLVATWRAWLSLSFEYWKQGVNILEVEAAWLMLEGQGLEGTVFVESLFI